MKRNEQPPERTMPGKVRTGTTAQMASSGCFTGLRETRATALKSFKVLLSFPRSFLGEALVYKHQEVRCRLCVGAKTGSNAKLPWWEYA